MKALRPGTKSITSYVTSGKTNKPSGTSASFVRVVRIKKDQGMRCLAVVRARTRKELKLCGHAMLPEASRTGQSGQFLLPTPPRCVLTEWVSCICSLSPLAVVRMVVCVSVLLLSPPACCLPDWHQKSNLYVCTFFAALQMESSVPSF